MIKHGKIQDISDRKSVVTLDGKELLAEDGRGFILITFDAGKDFSNEIMDTRVICQATRGMLDDGVEAIQEMRRQAKEKYNG